MENTGTRTRTTFKAAVYEHAVILPPDPLTPVSRTSALNNMMKNLDIYQKQAEIAAKEVRYYSRPDRQIRRQHLLIFQPGHSKGYTLACVHIDDSDQTAQPRSLIGVVDSRSRRCSITSLIHTYI